MVKGETFRNHPTHNNEEKNLYIGELSCRQLSELQDNGGVLLQTTHSPFNTLSLPCRLQLAQQAAIVVGQGLISALERFFAGGYFIKRGF